MNIYVIYKGKCGFSLLGKDWHDASMAGCQPPRYATASSARKRSHRDLKYCASQRVRRAGEKNCSID